MRRLGRIGLLLLLAAALPLLLGANGQLLLVKVKEAYLMEQKSFLSRSLIGLGAGHPVSVLATELPWHQVKAVVNDWEYTGWLHVSAVAEPASEAVGSGGAEVGVDEAYLASKGFNERVEAQYRRGREAAYREVEQMVRRRITAEALRAFWQRARLGDYYWRR